MPEENIPRHSRIIHLPFSVQVWSPYRDMRLFLSEGSVHLSRQFLAKLTDSAIIKVALRGDLSEVATGSRWLAAHPAVAEGVAAGAEPEDAMGRAARKWQFRRCI